MATATLALSHSLDPFIKDRSSKSAIGSYTAVFRVSESLQVSLHREPDGAETLYRVPWWCCISFLSLIYPFIFGWVCSIVSYQLNPLEEPDKPAASTSIHLEEKKRETYTYNSHPSCQLSSLLIHSHIAPFIAQNYINSILFGS